MANRAMAAKVERARKQAGELAHIEFAKPFYAGNATLGAAKARSVELAALVAAFNGKVTVCKTGHHQGQTKRTRVCLGTTTPGRAVLRYGRPWNV